MASGGGGDSESEQQSESKGAKKIPCESQEPVEDEYHGRILVESEAAFPISTTEISEAVSLSSSDSCGLRSCAAGESPRMDLDEMRIAIDRIASLEARMEVQERVNQMTKHELMDTRMQIGELEENPKKTVEMEEQLAELKVKTDKHLAKLAQDKDSLLAENEELKQTMLQRALMQAEAERQMLMDFDRRLEEKLSELKGKLRTTCEERDQAKLERDQARAQDEILKCELENLQRDRDNWRKRSLEANKKNAGYVTLLREQGEVLEKKEKVLMKFEEQCEEVSNENTRLRRENSFLRETIFRVVRVGEVDITDAIGTAAADLVFECFSCHTTYKPSLQTHLDKNCRFHPLPAMQHREWKRWPVGQSSSDADMTKLYWPCCDTLSYSRPDGCCLGRHHQSWERDIIMKTVLSSKLDQDY